MNLLRAAFRGGTRYNWRRRAWEADSDLLRRTGLPSIDGLFAMKKAVWVAHVHRGDETHMKKSLQNSANINDSWWTSYKKDLSRINMAPQDVSQLATQPLMLKRKIKENSARPYSDQNEPERISENDLTVFLEAQRNE